MGFIDDLPLWVVAAAVVIFRIADVAIGTMRTITVVQGLIKVSVVLAFFEILIWVAVVSQVVVRISTTPILALAYAVGYAAGNAAGIALERRIAMGTVIVRMVSTAATEEIARTLNKHGEQVTAFQGESESGSSVMLWTMCPRREVRELIENAKLLDPNLMYAVEPVREWSLGLAQPLPHATGWRAVFKKK